MIDLALDSSHDIYLTDYEPTMSAGIDQVRQRLLVRLKLFMGEWYLDEEAGLPYYKDVLTASPKLALVEAVFRKEILSLPEIEALTAFEMTYDGSARQLGIDFTAISSEGEVTISEVFP